MCILCVHCAYESVLFHTIYDVYLCILMLLNVSQVISFVFEITLIAHQCIAITFRFESNCAQHT